jgi:hypothetical protein
MLLASKAFPLLELPDAVLSTALGSFLDGKSMSTFLIVIQGCSACNKKGYVLSLLRDALAHRYGLLLQNILTLKVEDDEQEEMKDVLLVLKKDIRTSNSTAKFPRWCALLDYFEKQLLHNYHHHGWIVWCGPLETVFGTFQACLRCQREWTLGALQFWYYDVELLQFSIVHPSSRTVTADQYNDSTYYGTIESLTDQGRLLLERLYITLEHDPEHWQHYLVLQSRCYEEQPPEFITPKTGDPSELLCYWDSEEHAYDWEDALEQLGDNVIRIMKRCVEVKGSFP